MRTVIETVDPGTLGGKDSLYLRMHRDNIGFGLQSEGYSALIAKYDYASDVLVQDSDCVGDSWKQLQKGGASNVFSLRPFLVDYTVSIKENSVDASLKGPRLRVVHSGMITSIGSRPDDLDRRLCSLPQCVLIMRRADADSTGECGRVSEPADGPYLDCVVLRSGGRLIEALHDVIQQIEFTWTKKRLLVVGDVMLDKYIWGDVSRISPEAPVPVIRSTHESEQPGGAANVAMNLARLGAEVTVVGFTGDDRDHSSLFECLRSNGIAPELIVCSGFPTITKLRILGGRQQMLRLDTERPGERSEADYDRLLAVLARQIDACDGVILSDYAKGVLLERVCQEVIHAARRKNIPVLVDPKSADFSKYRGATTICPNLGELSAATRLSAQDLKPVLGAAEGLVETLGLDFLTATLSEKGIALVRPGNCYVAPAVARQVFDVSGAGDTVISVLALCLVSGLAPQTAVQVANIAAGVVVGKVGTVPVERHELVAALSPQLALQAEDKVVTRSELVTRAAFWRASGERVVFTNGCFDLLHVGHITVLEHARRFGDRLVVAINSDQSVCQLKGPTRPIVGERERSRVLAALAAVDAVVIFDEPTPVELICAVRPDVLVKGGDYDVDTVVGANEVQSWGGQVKIVPTVEGFSTTRLIEKGAGK
jgi:D-beta-D-heptose 7-phosphate kinase/D-beta-D-heptose 1-phosphate adenosyltransferase